MCMPSKKGKGVYLKRDKTGLCIINYHKSGVKSVISGIITKTFQQLN